MNYVLLAALLVLSPLVAIALGALMWVLFWSYVAPVFAARRLRRRRGAWGIG